MKRRSLASLHTYLRTVQRTQADLWHFLSSFAIIQVSHEVGRQAAQYYKHFRSKGLTLSSTDALIAATARVQQLILVTENLRDFPMTDIEKRSL